jgi:hypothetical protein
MHFISHHFQHRLHLVGDLVTSYRRVISQQHPWMWMKPDPLRLGCLGFGRL